MLYVLIGIIVYFIGSQISNNKYKTIAMAIFWPVVVVLAIVKVIGILFPPKWENKIEKETKNKES